MCFIWKSYLEAVHKITRLKCIFFGKSRELNKGASSHYCTNYIIILHSNIFHTQRVIWSSLVVDTFLYIMVLSYQLSLHEINSKEYIQYFLAPVFP